MAFAPDHILGRLEELNDALALERADPVEWVVCGGTALALHGLIRRTTRDVDVLGERQDTHIADLHELEPTAQEIESSIRWIARLPDQQSRIRPELKRIVEVLGHEDLASYIIL